MSGRARFNIANQLRYLQFLSLFLLVTLILEKLFALLTTAYGVPPPSLDPTLEGEAVRNEVYRKAITIMVLLWASAEYVWAAYEVFPSFIEHFSGVDSAPFAVWGVIATVLLQVANAAFCAQVLAGPINALRNLAAMEQTAAVVRAQNYVGTHLFLIIVTIVGFVAMLVIEGILIAQREYWLEQNPEPEPMVLERLVEPPPPPPGAVLVNYAALQQQQAQLAQQQQQLAQQNALLQRFAAAQRAAQARVQQQQQQRAAVALVARAAQ